VIDLAFFTHSSGSCEDKWSKGSVLYFVHFFSIFTGENFTIITITITATTIITTVTTNVIYNYLKNLPTILCT